MIYPAVDVRSDASDLLLALLDDFGPIAVEERGDVTRVFFSNADARLAAHAALAHARYAADPVDVDDEDWARRSQEGLGPVTVGRITVFPSPECRASHPSEGGIAVVILPSMGFGTGHHASTRLCLHALQALDLHGRFVLDVGTGSGVLALAAVKLGAARAVGIDDDADAVQSAGESLALNPGVDGVQFRVADLLSAPLPPADVVTANLTGGLLMRSARLLLGLLRPEGTLVVSGLLADEREGVVSAFAPARVVWEREEDGWVALGLRTS